MQSKLHALTFALILGGLSGVAALAQSGEVAFKGLRAGAGLPVEITANQLDVSQKDETAVFTGDVVAIQGEMRLSSQKLVVEYVKGDKTKIDTLHATGNVLLATSTEAAEAEAALYTLTSGMLELTGNVLLTQATGTISGQKMVIDLNTGIGRMDGRVKTVLQPGAASTP